MKGLNKDPSLLEKDWTQ